MIHLKNINKKYHNKTILHDINLSINQGDFIMVMGANGAGKTTLLQLLSGVTKPDSGAIFFQDKNVTTENQYQRAQWLGKLAQNPEQNVITSMTVEENLALALLAQQKETLSWGLNKINDTLYTTILKEYNINLATLKNIPMKQLSGGQRQLIAFIMMTLSRPALLLLDEPTAALDISAATTLLSAVVRFIKNHAMTGLMITHDPEIAHRIGNRLWLVKDQNVFCFNEEEKKELKPEQLMGSIDYQKIIGQ
jgi:putative ABC transport system ATP-binding protein